MPWSYFIDSQQRTVFTRFFGVVTPADIRAERETIRSDPKFDPGFSQFVDAYESKPAPDFPTDKVREFGASSIFEKSSRRAIVVNGDLAFGLARMFATYREIHGEVNLQVFRNREDAFVWLGVIEPSLPEQEASGI